MKIFYTIFFLFNMASLAESFTGTIQLVSPALLKRMLYSWNKNGPVSLHDLRYLRLKHWGFDGKVYDGELIVHALVAHELLDIFNELFEEKFPIACMKLVDEFEGDDDISMDANNCYAHCTRKVAHVSRWSNHAYGLAIDINPLQNPFLRGEEVYPAISRSAGYVDRQNVRDGMITPDAAIYKIFTSRGWIWGGECFEDQGYRDLHHFQKVIPGLNKTVNDEIC